MDRTTQGTRIAAWLACLALAPMAGPPAARGAGQARAYDLEGRAVDPLRSGHGDAAVVLVFTAIDCPISNRYAPVVQRLHDELGPRGVRVRLVFPNPSDTPDAIRAHLDRFGYRIEALRDPRQELARLAGVTVAPEAAVFDRAGKAVYRGRIDDRYVDFGVERPAPTRRDLEEALRALLDGRPIAQPATRAVGCLLPDFVRDDAAPAPPPPTFARDVAPIVFEACAPCHRPGGPAPFSLLTHADVSRRATQIAEVTARRFMPPWKAAPQPDPFVGQRRLSDAEIGLIRRWVETGALEGERGAMPAPPAVRHGWQLGAPDLIVTLPEPYLLGPEGTDVFRIFAIPLPVAATRYVRGLEFLPGNPTVVHHANIRIDRTPATRRLDAADPAPGYDGLMPRSAVYPEGHFLGWTPGQIAPLVPADLAWPLAPGADLVVQLHMQPSGAYETVRPSIGLYFGAEPPARTPSILRLGSQGIDIPAGDGGYVVEDAFLLPVDVEVHAVQPHAHYRARTVRGTATLPDGRTRSLIRIDDWDFRWQHVYRYAAPVALPRGTTLSMRYVYDNSAANPHNPQVPPRRVFWGQRSFDEMGDLWFQMVTTTESDRATLHALAQGKMMAEDVVGYRTLLRSTPDDPELHDDLAMLYLELGRPADAAGAFAASAALKGRSPAAHFNLGTALALAGRLDEAVRSYRGALALDPGYGAAHNNLASALVALGRGADAMHHFREAVRLDPQNAEALKNLAWRLATGGSSPMSDAEEAVRLAERAARLTKRRDAQALDALAAAHAAAGRFDRAIELAEEALSLQPAAPLGTAIRARLVGYRQRTPYRER